jgi:lysozyme family protein
MVLACALAVANEASAGIGSCGSCLNWDCQEALTIKQVQQALQVKGGVQIKADGSFGPGTEAAIRLFASKNKITDMSPRNRELLRLLFGDADFEVVRRRIFSAWIC